MTQNDPDLPDERESFRPAAGAIVDYSGHTPRIAMVIPLSIERQQNIHHNRLRYTELQKLRAGQTNHYRETRYRH